VSKVPTDVSRGFSLPRRRAPRTIAVYFMYDVKQADRRSGFAAVRTALVDKPGLGKTLVGRGARVRRARIALVALHAIRGQGRRCR
jgi:hypothetical protein